MKSASWGTRPSCGRGAALSPAVWWREIRQSKKGLGFFQKPQDGNEIGFLGDQALLREGSSAQPCCVVERSTAVENRFRGYHRDPREGDEIGFLGNQALLREGSFAQPSRARKVLESRF